MSWSRNGTKHLAPRAGAATAIDWSLWMVFELRDERMAWVAYAADLDGARTKAEAHRVGLQA
jgi:hypothetical protein